MTSLAPISQSAEDLLLAVLENDNLPALRVLVSESFQIRGWRFEFAIIGESHYCRIEHEGQLQLLEVLACMKIEESACKLYQPFREMQPFAWKQKAYQVGVHFENRLPVWTQRENSLRYHFPITHGQVPETRLQWQIEKGFLRWQSLHSYPDESRLVVVLSESVFRFS